MKVTAQYTKPVDPPMTSVTIELDAEQAKRLLALLARVSGYYNPNSPIQGMLTISPNTQKETPRPLYYGYDAAQIRDGVQNELCAELNKIFKLY